MLRWLVRLSAALTLAAALGAGAYGLLELGMKRATTTDRLAADALRVLDATRGAGAIITVEGRRLVAACRSTKTGTGIVSLDDGSRLVLARTHVTRVQTSRERELLEPEPADFAAAAADLSGSHDLYSRELTAALLAGKVTVRVTRFAGRDGYALRLGDGEPLVELLVDRETLRPFAARYVSRTSSGQSLLVPEVKVRRRRSTGC
jgi:hypothetical protein